MTRPGKTWVEVSGSALTENVRAFRRLVKPETMLMAVVKSNAYGHGQREVAATVDGGVDWFGVDSLDEGIALRSFGIQKPILVLGYTLKERLREFAEHDLACVAYDQDVIRAMSALPDLGRPIRVHLKIETGTTRQGVAGEELRALAREILDAKNIEVEGAYTHFANAEEDEEYTKQQIARFNEGLEILKGEGIVPKIRHAACTAAVLMVPEAHFDMVRLGISMYGLWPSEHVKNPLLRKEGSGEVSLVPALAWKTVVAQVKNVKKGTPVSYGLTERVERDSKIAVLPVGYWDGYDRHLSNTAEVLIGGNRCKIVGRVCMNMCMADVTDVENVKPEDEVVLIGEQGHGRIIAEELAAAVGTINYEIVTRINPNIPRTVV